MNTHSNFDQSNSLELDVKQKKRYKMKIANELKRKQEELIKLLEITKTATTHFDKLIRSGKLNNELSILSVAAPSISRPFAVHLMHEKVNVTIVYFPEENSSKTKKELAEKKAKKYLSLDDTSRVNKTFNNGNLDLLIENVTKQFPVDAADQSRQALAINTVNELKPLAISESVLMTGRQRQVIEFIADGSSNKEIAQKLNLSIYTVKSHVRSILAKLSLNTRVQIAKYAHLSKYSKIAI
jgi:DNA-binding NarL/FixJ family response regulator